MSEYEMDLFEFASSNPAVQPEIPTEVRQLSRNALLQAALAFLVSRAPDAQALNVPTRTVKYRASAAGFWKHSRRSGTVITRTALVMMYDDFNSCFSDCAGKSVRMKKINDLQLEKIQMEADIRRNEPHLAAADDLFSEFRTWDYAASSNREYHRLCRTIAAETEILCRGSRLERIRQAGVADQCYLAIPQNQLMPELIPAEWGVVELFPEKPRFKLLREAPFQNNVTPEQRASFAFNIAVASSANVRFANGVDNDAALRRLPRRRGKLSSGSR